MEMNIMMPVVFIGHGSPMNLIEDNPWTNKWVEIAEQLPKPKAILMISAHWFTEKSYIQVDENPGMIYDMYGFPDPIYELQYPAKTDRQLINRVKELLGDNVAEKAGRGYDHGAYAPLLKMFPHVDVPVVQLSVNGRATAEEWFAIGQKLSVLRTEGILIFGSGDIVHNLRLVNPRVGNNALPPAAQFEETILRKVQPNEENDLQGLLNWQSIEGAVTAAEYPDHLAPFFYCLGAAVGLSEIGKVSLPDVKIWTHDYVWGTLSMTSLTWGI